MTEPDSTLRSRTVLDHGSIVVERDGAVLTVTLDRPDSLNAQTPAMWHALAGIGDDLPPDVRVVVLRGAGRSFSAGLDRAVLSTAGGDGEPSLADLARLPTEDIDRQLVQFQRAFTWWSRSDIISIAVVQGHAIGAGFQLALACDLRVVAHDARLAMREAGLGLVPDLAGTLPLVRAVGYSRALELCVTGRFVGADEATRIGLAQMTVPRADLDGAVADLVAALTGPDAEVVRATKSLLQGAWLATGEEQRAAERTAQAGRLKALARGPGK